MHAGEPLEAALRRELREEADLSLSIVRLLTVRKDRYRLFLEAVYVCRHAGGTFRPSNEVTDVRWCRPEALPAGTHPHHAPLIRAAAGVLTDHALKKSPTLPNIALE